MATLEEAIARANELSERELANPGSVSAAEIHAALAAIRTSRKAAPAARRSRTKTEPLALDALFPAAAPEKS